MLTNIKTHINLRFIQINLEFIHAIINKHISLFYST